MRYATVVASVAALASLVVTSNLAANAVNARAARIEMAQATVTPAVPDIWFIKGAITINGTTQFVRFVVPDEDRGGEPAVLTFDSQESCDTARHDDPDIAKPLALLELVVAKRGGTVVISCEKWEHPAVKPPGTEI